MIESRAMTQVEQPLRPIHEVADELGLDSRDLVPIGHHKAKVLHGALRRARRAREARARFRDHPNACGRGQDDDERRAGDGA